MSESVVVPVARQWKRFCSVVLTDSQDRRISIGDLRCSFDIRQFDLQAPNTADIIIYNLSETTRRELSREYSRVALWAGYESNLAPIFEGTVKQFRDGRASPVDTYLNIRAADGDVAYTQATINVTLAAGATAEDVVTELLKVLETFGVQRGRIEGLPPDRSPRAIVLSGMVRDLLREFCNGWGLSWSFQGQRLDIVPREGRVGEGDPIVLNSATGLIGRPEQTIEGIRVRCLLNPQIRVNSTLQIDNKPIQRGQYDLSYLGEVQNELLDLVRVTDDGLYRVIAVDHIGDTHGQDWYCEIVCLALGDPITIPQAQRGRT
jgi:hypothetical protein